MVNDKLSVSELASTALTALPPVAALPALVEALRASRYQTFPISPDTDAALRSGAPAEFCICTETLASGKEPATVLNQLACQESCRACPGKAALVSPRGSRYTTCKVHGWAVGVVVRLQCPAQMSPLSCMAW